MLFETVPPEKLAEFSLTELDMNLKRDVMFEPDLGMPLSVLDVDRYIVPSNAPPLDPADLALFQVRKRQYLHKCVKSGSINVFQCDSTRPCG